jgi:cytochrome c peroxidase
MKKIKIFFTGVLMISLMTVFTSCQKDPVSQTSDSEYQPTPYTIQIPKFFPTALNIPADNPMTVEGIELGRYLFYDGRLCGKTNDTLMSCGTCHLPQYSFENGVGHGTGVTGISTPHVMLPMVNLVFNSNGYLWNGKVYTGNPIYTALGGYGGNLEDICWMGVTAPWEFHSDTNHAREAIKNISIYPSMFEKAFGSKEITFKKISMAIAQFMRTLISSNSKFDKYLRGELQLTNSELNGYVIFNTEKGDCFHCHGTILFTTNLFYNNAKDTIFNDPRDRYAVTLNPIDHGAYKATTLRNIALTGPYMHDGRYNTLDQVINFYSDSLRWSPYVSPFMTHLNQGGDLLTPTEKADLKAFLLTLTDTDFINNPSFSKPADLP